MWKQKWFVVVSIHHYRSLANYDDFCPTDSFPISQKFFRSISRGRYDWGESISNELSGDCMVNYFGSVDPKVLWLPHSNHSAADV